MPKCKVLEMGSNRMKQRGKYSNGNECISKTNVAKNLGVWITNKLSPDKHINRITGDTYQQLRNIRIAFKYLDEEMINKLIMSLIRQKLEYASMIWSPHKKKDIRKHERIQRAATKMAPNLKDLPYEEILSRLKLPTLENRREIGDFIAVYRALKGLEKIDREDLFVWDDRTRTEQENTRRN